MSQIDNAICKRCDRHPSLMGKEPLYLVPYESTYYVICGSCMSRLCKILGVDLKDLLNPFTHSDNYHFIISDFLRL